MQLRSVLPALGLLFLFAVQASAQSSTMPLYRVFLADGAALPSFGEWTRVDNRVVFSMPLAPGAGPGELHLVSVPVDRVDLQRSERYADAVRAAHYAATRGETDFSELSGMVAQTLNQVATLADPKQRLATAEAARRTLADWPRRHYGYRASDVREILSVLDEVIAGLRAQAGAGGFDLALAANTVAPPPEPLLPAPDHEESVENLMTAARVASSPVERVSLLQSLVALIDRAIAYLPASFAAAFRANAASDISEEERIDASYAALRSTALAEAARLAERADVRAIERLRRQVHERDAGLGSRRPDDVAAVVAAVDEHLDIARRRRLAHDQWLLSASRLRAYRKSMTPYVQALLSARSSLDDIRLLAGPLPQQLGPLGRVLSRNARFVALMDTPPQLSAVHAGFRSAYALAENAVQLRRDAVESADVDLAHRASAAAAGAVMLLDRARADLKAALEPPLRVPSTQ